MTRSWPKWLPLPALVTTFGVAALVIGVRQLGLLQQTELNFYDLYVRSRPAPDPDPRILTVLITEQDIQAQKTWPLPDATITDLLTRLNAASPRAIGLDIFRDIPQPPGHDQIRKILSLNPRIIPVCKSAGETADQPEVPPPPSIPTDQVPERVGFADIPLDNDGVIRRNLFVINNENAQRCTTPFSFALMLALRYIEQEPDQKIDLNNDGLTLNNVHFAPLTRDAGGYVGVDDRGMQTLLKYRSGSNVSRTVSLMDVLTGRVSDDLIRDRVVLIGVSAPSIKDIFLTPYSGSDAVTQQMPGVVVHAQMVSQFLSAALDDDAPIWYWPLPFVLGWIILWAGVGSVLGWWLRQPLWLAAAVAGGGLALVGGSFAIFVVGNGWIPVVPPLIALMLSSVGMVGYVGYHAQQEQKSFQEKVKEQEKALALMRSLMAENTAALNQALQQPTEITGKPRSLLGGRYKIQRVLGAGGFGRTYLAQDTQRPGNPICVVKHLRPGRNDERFMQVARRLFNTEAEILEKLGRHDQIPLLLAYVEENQEFYLVQEFIEGRSLSEEVKQKHSEAEALKLLREMLEVLSFVHSHYVIHRDIKPDNIIRRAADGRLVLIDFGAVKQMQPQEIQKTQGSTVVIGTMGYAPPEQLSGQPTLSSDIYAVGMIVLQALTGIKPRDLPRDPRTGEVDWQSCVTVSDAFAAILNKMVKFNFSDRYESAKDALQEVQSLSSAMAV
ncbi:CHASE2 domain-containing protein [Parathermosynechococcus lividus]|uniref:CHASE2 domain-containing protein n=1 Tax=Parathermosynechococcus lividus TaxID=33070 RepID=UPI001D0D441E|nr:CHASE2 domain-containing serine/threonine-protein kinase [Thermostichus lividus]